MTDTATKPRLAILISGRGSNMQSIVNACNNEQINADICCVLSNKNSAMGLKFAKSNGIETRTVSHRDYPEREFFDRELIQALTPFSPDFIILAGFMRILTPVFINHYENRILNIHPSLLPKYPGLHTHDRALEAGDREHGASVHFVTNELDSGPVIIQGTVDVEAGDTPDTLATRVLGSEHVIYPQAVEWLAEGLISTDGKHCFYKGSAMIKPANWYNSALSEPVTQV